MPAAVYSGFLPVITMVFTVFFHRPGKNTFCHGKNPTLPHSHTSIISHYFKLLHHRHQIANASTEIANSSNNQILE